MKCNLIHQLTVFGNFTFSSFQTLVFLLKKSSFCVHLLERRLTMLYFVTYLYLNQ